MSEEEKNFQEEQSVETPVSEPTVEYVPTEEDASALKEASETERKKAYKTGSKVAAFIVFFITLCLFAVCEYYASVFLYLPMIKGAHDFGEAIAAVFGATIGLVFTAIFGIAQLPFNIASIVLFARLRGKSDKKRENRLFTALLIISVVMLVIMVLTFAVFLISGAAHNDK